MIVSQVEQALQDLNLLFCELTSFLLRPASHGLTENRAARPTSTTRVTNRPFVPHIDRVCEYVVKALKGDNTGQTHSTSSLARAMSAAAYVSILPTVWALLNHSDLERVKEICGTILEHSIKTTSASPVKRHTIEFIGRLILVCVA
jgi:pre-rRNA-processing protein IPI1